MYNNTGLEYVCPLGFVIPDHPQDSQIEWIAGSNCAVACISPVVNYSTFMKGIVLKTILVWSGSIAVLFNWCTSKMANGGNSSLKLLTFSLLVMCFIGSSISAIISFIPTEAVLCRDNANSYTQQQGISACVIDAISNIYTGVGAVMAWFMFAINAFLMLVLGRKEPEKEFKWYYITMIYIFPLIPVVGLLSEGVVGYGKGNPACFTYTSNLDLW